MPLPNENEIAKFGPLIAPFGRNTRTDKNKILAKGEDIYYGIEHGTYDASSNGFPDDLVTVNIQTFELLLEDCPLHKEDYINEKYLWVIGEWGLRMIRELTPNKARKPKQYVCHTNLTGGKHAYQGGELWFCEDGRVGINFFSDRYGAQTTEEWETVISHFHRVNYTTTVELFPMG